MASANTGLFESIDDGNDWTNISLPIAGTFVFTIVFDPVTPSTMYLGTNGGVVKSVDTGSTWTTLNNFGLSPGNLPNVRGLAIDPATPATMYVASFGQGLFKT